MKTKIAALGLVLICSPTAFSQTNIKPAPKSADSSKTSEISSERREQALVKLLEGQRILWNLSRRRSPRAGNTAQLAREALKSAIKLDPTLAEAYTVLAEMTLNTTTDGIEEAIMLAKTAIKINPDNFGGHLLLGRLYTIKSKFNRGDMDAAFTEKAIGEWKEIARLDSRNAEAFAFLSELYAKTNKTPERIAALKNWLSASAPLEMRFYQTLLGAESNLSPESASLKLGEALLETGQLKESIEVLSRLIADNPENAPAVELLREAVQSADVNSSAVARQSLTLAVYANPKNVSLISLLAQVEARAGNVEKAAKILREFSAEISGTDKISAANLQIALGDIYAGLDRFNEAAAAYENALAVRGVNGDSVVGDEERDFTIRAVEKTIQVYKKANRPADAKLLIERARVILGKQDLFPDRQLIMFYRETGKTSEAIDAIRRLRAKNADDYGLLRLEATVLTESGKVDDAVALIKPLLNKKTTTTSGGVRIGEEGTFSIAAPMYDDFTNYIFISNLYAQAKRGKEAIEAANQAISTGRSEEKIQIGKLTLATAQQMSGNFAAAENTLRELLKQSPGNPIALNNLGYFLIERDTKLDEALNLIEQAVKIDPTNPSYLDSLGWAYFKLGNLNQAEKYLKEALRNDDSSATIQEHLGDVYAKQGKLEPAKSAWQKSLNFSFEAEQTTRLKSKLQTAK
ncbi:MAG TPA: tetratricopeptide repeat protein [Pyrinomonadaceae bacterium]|nr:tetratricopeptide repeat protein [Pyrinomonadaceae bacterium]